MSTPFSPLLRMLIRKEYETWRVLLSILSYPSYPSIISIICIIGEGRSRCPGGEEILMCDLSYLPVSHVIQRVRLLLPLTRYHLRQPTFVCRQPISRVCLCWLRSLMLTTVCTRSWFPSWEHSCSETPTEKPHSSGFDLRALAQRFDSVHERIPSTGVLPRPVCVCVCVCVLPPSTGSLVSFSLVWS